MEKVFSFTKPTKTFVKATDTYIEIERKGALNALNVGLTGGKRIPYRNITAVQFKKATIWVNGYIQFSLLGGGEKKGGVFAATQDENTIMFSTKFEDEAEELRQLIEAKIEAANAPMQTPAQSPSTSPLEQIKQLKELLDIGAISEEEFNQKKQELLNL